MLKEFTQAQELAKQAFIKDQEVSLQEFIKKNDLEAWVTVVSPKKMLHVHIDKGLKFPLNEYEMVVKMSKKLEAILKTDFSGPEMQQAINDKTKGIGLHDYINKSTLDQSDLVQTLHRIATIRNKLIHEEKFDSLKDLDTSRQWYIDMFENSVIEMGALTYKKKMNV